MRHFITLTAALIATVATAEQPALHPVESYCATYQVGGINKGEFTTCQRQHGHERFEIWDTTMGFGPFKKKDQRHIIYRGAWVFTNDGTKATRTKNPIYEQLVEQMQSVTPEDIQQRFMNAMQYDPTGEFKKVGDVDCEVNRSAATGSVCLTDDGIMAEQEVMGQWQRITLLEKGISGDESLYDPEAWPMTIADGPDIGKVLQRLKGMNTQGQ